MSDDPSPDPRVVAPAAVGVNHDITDEERTRPEQPECLGDLMEGIGGGYRSASVPDSQELSAQQGLLHGILGRSAKLWIRTVRFEKPNMLLAQAERSGDLDQGDEHMACPRAQGRGCGRLRGSRFAEGNPAQPVESLEHLDVALGKIVRHSPALRDPAEFIFGVALFDSPRSDRRAVLLGM